MSNNLKKRILAWVEDIGREEAGRRLVLAGVHIDTAVRLLGGSYKSDPKRELVAAIEAAMKK